MSTTNNTPLLTAEQLWDLIDGAFPIKAQGFRYDYRLTGDETYRQPHQLFYCPSRTSQQHTPELREWSVIELKKLKAIVGAFGWSVRIGEGSGIGFWPIVYPTAE